MNNLPYQFAHNTGTYANLVNRGRVSRNYLSSTDDQYQGQPISIMEHKPIVKKNRRKSSRRKNADSKSPKVKFDFETTEGSNEQRVNEESNTIMKYESQNELND